MVACTEHQTVEQCSFRSGEGCVDQVFVKIIVRNTGENEDLFVTFMDLKKAYNRVDSDALHELLNIWCGRKGIRISEEFLSRE